MKIIYNSYHYAVVVQLVERLVANEKVAGSNPVCRSKTPKIWVFFYFF